MKKNTFYITTPIYYSNGVPHIGHAYSSLIADTIANYHRLQWSEVRFSTWVDENSQKVVESAEEKEMSVMEYADMMAWKHQSVWDGLSIHYTDFIRTTEPRHHAFVQKVLQKSWENWDIYAGNYEGLYCVGCESFKKESDLVEKPGASSVGSSAERFYCPDHPNKKLQFLKEKNYFFRLSRYQERILDFFEAHPDFVTPKSRYNEIIEFVRWGLEDFSISRETNRFGIPLPFDATQVTYVWYDALFNYLTVVQDDEKKWWPADIHVIGKDIIKFHGIYWPAMLWSAGYEAPKNLLATGHFTVDWQKMSKTIGNVIDPVEYSEIYSRDGLLLYLLSAFPIGEDGDFDKNQAILMYNAKLANNLWNLLNRCLVLTLKIWGVIGDKWNTWEWFSEENIWEYFSSMDKNDLKTALDRAFSYASEINKYADEQTPWKLDIDSQRDELEEILFTMLFHLKNVALMLLPFFESKMQELLVRIGFSYVGTLEDSVKIPVSAFTIQEKWEPLYLRIKSE